MSPSSKLISYLGVVLDIVFYVHLDREPRIHGPLICLHSPRPCAWRRINPRLVSFPALTYGQSLSQFATGIFKQPRGEW